MKGCSILQMTSSRKATVPCVSVFSGPSAPCSTGFDSSTYQSQKAPQTKR